MIEYKNKRTPIKVGDYLYLLVYPDISEAIIWCMNAAFYILVEVVDVVDEHSEKRRLKFDDYIVMAVAGDKSCFRVSADRLYEQVRV